ncbi:hypothetical protein [Caulobacter endophyticus]|uniref:hypothetical protein n=1 Tax=Caulobacter endophyticus TaxID=2172652 RepID=UPI00240EB549|nr:hypothetical protein [Caulobacter endophyticus]MDG2528048.1 hypothetical protein [Caulobacter endophyticus]
MRRLSWRAALASGLALASVGPAMASASLSNARASAEARGLYQFLWSLYGRRTLTGQQEGVAHVTPIELDYLAKVTGCARQL